MSFLRARQRSITALFPHQANRTHLIPNRKAGGQLLTWDVIGPFTDTELLPVAIQDMTDFLNEPPGTAPAKYSATGLPTGLTINVDDGLISGVAPAAAVFASCQITATNAFGAVASALFTWTITV